MESFYDKLSENSGKKLVTSIGKLRTHLGVGDIAIEDNVDFNEILKTLTSGSTMLKVPIIKSSFNTSCDNFAAYIKSEGISLNGQDPRVRLGTIVLGVGGVDVLENTLMNATMHTPEDDTIFSVFKQDEAVFGKLVFGYLTETYPEFGGIMEYVKMFASNS